MKLKQSVVMFLILFALLSSVCFGIAVTKIYPTESTEPEIVEDVIPESFVRTINGNEDVPKEVMNVITSYMDDYFKSIYTLEFVDTSKYFKQNIDGEVSNQAIKLVIESRKLYDFDFTMSDAHYDLHITNCENVNGKYQIDFLEDDYFCFKFLDGISSETYDIENSMVIEKVGDEYKIASYEKIQGYYSMFNDEKDNTPLNDLYNFYLDRLTKVYEDENYKKDVASTKPYHSDKTFDIKYDRDSACKYIQTYYHTRNDDYYNFSDEGGNCQNFASQSLLVGGMLMDDEGEYQWYYNGHLDYVPAWVHVGTFADYSQNNEGRGLVCESYVNNIYYAEPGDIIQVGISSVSHTTVVSRIVNGHILLNSNSIDMKDFPLEAYTYPTRKLIKILGSNS